MFSRPYNNGMKNKNTLAKLLATENITVEHRKVETAHFDLKNRIVVLPLWKEMSTDLYDMLLGHEVGHALHTPLEGWHDNMNHGVNFKTFLNVVEDARIERKIKSKFPGIVKNFYAGYNELFDKDFFGVKDIDPNTLPLIDRINLHYKVGSMLAINFSEQEQPFIDTIDNLETWEEVVNVAKALYDYAGNNEEQEALEELMKKLMEANGEPGDDEGDGDYEQVPGGEADGETGSAPGGGEEETDKGPISMTDKNFRNNEAKFEDKLAEPLKYITFPKINTKKFINSIDDVLKAEWGNKDDMFFKLEEIVFDDDRHIRYGKQYTEIPMTFATAEQDEWTDFNKRNTSYISSLVQQFELKRQAACMKRSRQAKTGKLDMKKLWATKLTDDVFLSHTIVPEGKNHGMIFFVDFSGSMQDDIAHCLEQIAIQVSFCKKVGIPFDVYSFTTLRTLEDTDVAWEQRKNTQIVAQGGRRPGKLMITDTELHINHLISSDLSPTKYSQAFKNLLMIGKVYRCQDWRYGGQDVGCNRYAMARTFQLGGTPLNETLMLGRELIKEFQKKYKVEIMNCIYMTDGGPTGQLGVVSDDMKTDWHNEAEYGGVAITEGSHTTTYRTPANQYNRHSQYTMFEALKKFNTETVDANFINFHIGRFSKDTLQHEHNKANGERLYRTTDKFRNDFKGWNKNGFLEFNNYEGWTSQFLIKNGKNLQVEDGKLEVKSNARGDLLRGFKSFQSNKAKTRVFVNRFIEKIA